MKSCAEEHLSVRRTLEGKDYPDCWDSPSFAHNLRDAYEGFMVHESLRVSGRKLVLRVAQENENCFPPPGGEYFSNSKGLQKLAYQAIFDEQYQTETALDSLYVFCARRCADLFCPFVIFGPGDADIRKAFLGLEDVSAPSRIKVVKSWLNGWATSHRMHEDVIHDCLLGCHGQIDSLSHYINCPHLFALQRYLFEGISEDPLVRFGIKHTNPSSLKILSCTFSAYHALKAEVRAGKINPLSVNWLRCAWSVSANTLKAEAGEMSLHTRAFSLTKFVCFLTSGGGSLPALENSSASQDTQ